METAMRMGELGQAAGVDIETIRYYEKAGLLRVSAASFMSWLRPRPGARQMETGSGCGKHRGMVNPLDP